MEDSSVCKPTESFEIGYITIRIMYSKRLRPLLLKYRDSYHLLSKYTYIGHFYEPCQPYSRSYLYL